ncbi:hypothetical protein RDI58_024624 [Solanum bulbocastanum]|uniref:Uncharacterized protein n=1 Tax=Solanum bulbocastanum TaxID=147425 RepID=A0AAN8T689_SOLBU
MVLEYPSSDQISVCLMKPESLNRSSNLVEVIRNEIDKERIRKEIIAEEVGAMLFNEKMGMGMGVSTVSRHDKNQTSEVPF